MRLQGGVAKTTVTYNLAWALASLGEVVITVDADPQCSLSHLCLHAPLEQNFPVALSFDHNYLSSMVRAKITNPASFFFLKMLNVAPITVVSVTVCMLVWSRHHQRIFAQA